MWGPGATPSPQGCRAPAPEPSNGEQAGQHTTYPELLELGPGQGGGEGAPRKTPHPTPCRPWSWAKSLRVCVTSAKSHILSGLLTIPHLSKSHLGLRDRGLRAAGRGPTLKELCTRVSSRSMTTQILSESWALASGSRYWTGVCCGDKGGAGYCHLSQAPVIFPTPALFLESPKDRVGTPAPSQLCPCQPWSLGVGCLALRASLPDLGNQRRGKPPLLKGKFRILGAGGP